MPLLDVPGASIHYEIAGTGPPLLLVPGANGDAPIFAPIVAHLKSTFTVLTYDRRGIAQSKLTDVQDYTQRLATDADDAAALIRELSSNAQPVYVFGNSSGAIVTLKLLERHASLLKAAIVHEPPLTGLLGPGGEQLQDYFQSIYDMYTKNGIEQAMSMFAEGLSKGPEAPVMKDALDFEKHPEKRADMTYFLEHELTKYTATPVEEFHVERNKDKIVPAHGADSLEGPLHATAAQLGATVGRESVKVPGGHLGFLLYPEEFAAALQDIFKPFSSYDDA